MPAPALRPLSLGEVLDVAFGLYRSRFAPLLVVSVTCQLVPVLIVVYLSSTGEFFGNLPALLGYLVLSVALSALAIAASTVIVSDAYLGQESSAAAALGRAVSMLGRLLAISFLSSLLIGIGFILIVVPGVVLMTGLALSTVVAVLESSPSATAAMGRSWELTKDYRGKVFLTILCTVVLLQVPGIAISAVWDLIGFMTGEIGELVKLVITSLLSLLIYPFYYVVRTVLYYDLRVRKEGFDLEVLASSLSSG